MTDLNLSSYNVMEYFVTSKQFSKVILGRGGERMSAKNVAVYILAYVIRL